MFALLHKWLSELCRVSLSPPTPDVELKTDHFLFILRHNCSRRHAVSKDFLHHLSAKQTLRKIASFTQRDTGKGWVQTITKPKTHFNLCEEMDMQSTHAFFCVSGSVVKLSSRLTSYWTIAAWSALILRNHQTLVSDLDSLLVSILSYAARRKWS